LAPYRGAKFFAELLNGVVGGDLLVGRNVVGEVPILPLTRDAAVLDDHG
jgi:hypothetical protein